MSDEAVRQFQFDEPKDGSDTETRKVMLDINGDQFHLADDMTGFELMRWIGITRGPNSTMGVVNFFERIVRDSDWERFQKLGERLRLQPKDYGRIAGDALDAYAAFPTTQLSGSTDGHTSTGSTSS